MTGLFRPRQSFLQNNAWQNQALNALHYNTAQQGSVVPLIYGTCRQQVNVIDFNNYRGPKGKKGKTGSLPIQGTSQSGKGGGGGKGKGSKKNGHYTIDVDFAICQGPVTFNSSNSIYSSSGVESFAAAGLNFHDGSDGQAADSHFNLVAYSGTCHVTGTPLDLGQSPVLPNIALEITGILTGINTGGFPKDANPGDVILDFLTNARYGAGFPPECVSQINHDDVGGITDTYGDYCRAAGLMISTSLDGHQKAIEWLNGLVILTNSALVWSGRLLKIIPYGDLQLANNGMTWSPYFTPNYNLSDKDFLPWHPHQDGAVPAPGDDDPIILTRTNPSDADNWVSIEYSDRLNFYNSTTLTSFDQGAIDTYGLRIGDSLPGRAFSAETPAHVSLQLILQRRLYIRNTGIKFQLGWQYALLEPMDLVSLTGRVGDNYLQQYPVRITSIEENDNGDLTIVAEDPQAGLGAPPTYPAPVGALYWPYGAGDGMFWSWDINVFVGGPLDPLAGDPVYDYNLINPPDSSTGTFSMWISLDDSTKPTPTDSYGLIRTTTFNSNYSGSLSNRVELAILIDHLCGVAVYLAGVCVYRSAPGSIKTDGSWSHIMASWETPTLSYTLTIGETLNFASVWVNGTKLSNTQVTPSGTEIRGIVRYSLEGGMIFLSAANTTPALTINTAGCFNYMWFDPQTRLSDPGLFRNLNGTPKDLGAQGENPMGHVPYMYFAYKGNIAPGIWMGFYPPFTDDLTVPANNWFGINWAGYRSHDSAYWTTAEPTSPNAYAYGDPAHPNMYSPGGNQPTACTGTSW